MKIFVLLILSVLPGVSVGAFADHASNPVFTSIVRDGVELGGALVRLPAPISEDGQGADAQQAALLRIAGSEQARADLLRDSVTAPFILKVHDAKANDGIVRLVDLWFVVRGDLDEIDPSKIASQASGRRVGAGNMEIQQRLLTAEELKPRDRASLDGRELSRWFIHVDGLLLDRIEVHSTSEVVASRTAESLVIASRTDRGFDAAGPFANRWRSLRPDGVGREQPYAGGIGYSRLEPLKQPEGAVLVEVHVAFLEPRAWFEGAPILRSKFAPVAQDQIRRLRREVRKGRSRPTSSR